MGSHIVEGEFQSDKYPWCQRGFVPLKTTDPDAQLLLWIYADLHDRDPEFRGDLWMALEKTGFKSPRSTPVKAYVYDKILRLVAMLKRSLE